MFKRQLLPLLLLQLVILMGVNHRALAQCASATNIYTFVHNNKSYEVVKESKTWANASACAVALGGYLAEIDDQLEQDAVYNAITVGANVSSTYTSVANGGGIAYVWIGATDQNTEGTWLWDGDNNNVGTNFWNGQGANGNGLGSAVGGAYHNWGTSGVGPVQEPDNFGNNQDGAAIGLAGWPAAFPGLLGDASEWNDIISSSLIYFVVEHDCQHSSATISESVCDSYTTPSGNDTYQVSGTYTDVIPNLSGCDSVITINLTVQSNDTTFSVVACNSYTVPSGNETYTTSGVYNDTVQNAAMCDSVLTINLTIGNNSSSITETACDSYTVPSGDETYTTSGMYADTVLNANGCDSILTINLTIGNNSSSITETACDSYTVPSGNETYTTSGIYMDTIVNSAGCDSVMTIDLTIVIVDTSFFHDIPNWGTLVANDTGASYQQWLNCLNDSVIVPILDATNQSYVIPGSAANIALAVTRNGCTNTSACRYIQLSSVEENSAAALVKAFPNPTSDKTTVQLGKTYNNVTATVRNLIGQQISQQNFGSVEQFQLSMGHESGIYFVEIETAEGKLTVLKVIVK